MKGSKIKKTVAVIATLLACLMLFSCGFDGGTVELTHKKKTADPDAGDTDPETEGGRADLKVGAIMVGDDSEGYTLAHKDGINAAVKAIKKKTGKNVSVVWKERVEETVDCVTAAESLIAGGATLIVSNSYGHQEYMNTVADKYANIQFVAIGGDFAAICGSKNLHNAYTNIYEARYVSGVVAGMKLAELVRNGEIKAENMDGENIKVGYVGAFPYAEVVSGYTAFYLGMKSVVENITMEVVYTQYWFSESLEGEAARYLMSRGCVIIGQHADSTGAPAAVQAARQAGTYTNVYSVGYNVDMLTAAPDVALTSAANNWEVYYEELFTLALEGKDIPTDRSKGYADNAVSITPLGKACAAGTQEKVDATIKAIKDGSLKVFDTSKFTVGGERITDAKVDLSYMDFSGSAPKVVYQGETKNALVAENGITYFSESTLRAAPYFQLRIDGIIENTLKFN